MDFRKRTPYEDEIALIKSEIFRIDPERALFECMRFGKKLQNEFGKEHVKDVALFHVLVMSSITVDDYVGLIDFPNPFSIADFYKKLLKELQEEDL